MCRWHEPCSLTTTYCRARAIQRKRKNGDPRGPAMALCITRLESLEIKKLTFWHIIGWVLGSDLHSLSSVLVHETKMAIAKMNDCVRNERHCLTNVPHLLINLRGRGDPEPLVGLLPKKRTDILGQGQGDVDEDDSTFSCLAPAGTGVRRPGVRRVAACRTCPSQPGPSS